MFCCRNPCPAPCCISALCWQPKAKGQGDLGSCCLLDFPVLYFVLSCAFLQASPCAPNATSTFLCQTSAILSRSSCPAPDPQQRSPTLVSAPGHRLVSSTSAYLREGVPLGENVRLHKTKLNFLFFSFKNLSIWENRIIPIYCFSPFICFSFAVSGLTPPATVLTLLRTSFPL